MRTAVRLSLVTVALALAALPACVDDKGEEEEAPSEDGKDDSFQRPTEHGVIPFGGAATSELTAQERHHTWTFALTGAARVDMTTSYAVLGQRRTDTVLYLYRKTATGTWGPYIARNDDYGTTTYSQLVRDLGAGEYRVLVKGYLASTRGKFKLSVGCQGEDCGPAPAACLFGEVYRDLRENPALTIAGELKVTAANLDTLSAEHQAWLVRAVQQSSHTDVTTPLEALGRVDQGEVNLTRVVDPTGRRTFAAFEYGAGDNSYGAVFEVWSGEMVTNIHDGDLMNCTVEAESCLLPEDWATMRNDAETFAVVSSRSVTAAAQLDAAEKAQVLAALRLAFRPDEVASIDEGIARTDDRAVDLRRYTHRMTGAPVTVVAFYAGDTSIGSIYHGATTELAGVINDLYIDGCTLFAP